MKWLSRWKEYKKNLKQTNKPVFYLVDWVETIVTALILALIIRTWIMQTSQVISGSMIPTLPINSRILVNKVVYHFRPLQRQEIVLFKYPYNTKKDFVKRLMGLPGEKIEVKRGTVYIHDQPVTEKGYTYYNDFSDFGPEFIPKDSYFMLGDNRPNSADSRVWGVVDKKYLIGKAFFCIWPPSHFGVLK
jgi:signal peptidase I